MTYDLSKLKQLAIGETGFLFDPSTGYIFTTNAAGVMILSALKEGKEAEEIKSLLLDEFETTPETVERDLFDFTNQLIYHGFIREA